MYSRMRQVPLERDINIAISGCFEFATSTQKGPFMAMLISCSRDTYLIDAISHTMLPSFWRVTPTLSGRHT